MNATNRAPVHRTGQRALVDCYFYKFWMDCDELSGFIASPSPPYWHNVDTGPKCGKRACFNALDHMSLFAKRKHGQGDLKQRAPPRATGPTMDDNNRRDVTLTHPPSEMSGSRARSSTPALGAEWHALQQLLSITAPWASKT